MIHELVRIWPSCWYQSPQQQDELTYTLNTQALGASRHLWGSNLVQMGPVLEQGL